MAEEKPYRPHPPTLLLIILTPFLIGIVLAILMWTGIWVPKPFRSPSAQPALSNNVTPSPSNNQWTTYVNENHGYQISYPAFMNAEMVETDILGLSSEAPQSDSNLPVYIEIQRHELLSGDTQLTPQKFILELDNNAAQVEQFSSQQGFDYYAATTPEGEKTIYVFYPQQPDTYVLIHCFTCNSDQDRQLFDQVVSYFEFLDFDPEQYQPVPPLELETKPSPIASDEIKPYM